ncbi:MAG: H-X9-DG-CTERM domain-containing protein [Candidatus Hydrogenedentales bacterium]|jgi:prepilin-type processing-associated H-X9-DG protein
MRTLGFVVRRLVEIRVSARFRWVLLFGVSASAVIVAVHFERQYILNMECEENMKLMWAALRSYSSEARGENYPALSPIAGRVMFRPDEVIPAHLQDTVCLISPYYPDHKTLELKAASDPASVVDDHSYWYTGCVFANDRSAQAWLAAYKQYMPQGLPVPEVDTVWPEYVKDFEAREREMPRTIEEFRQRIAQLEEAGRRVKGQIPQNYPLPHEWNAQLIMRCGVERFFIHDIGDPSASNRVCHSIPVLIERPDLHGNGGHVLYMDGHVEFVPYPGPFPMTRDFIEGLRSLDALEK